MGIISDFINSIKNSFDLGDTSKEARLTVSIILSMAFFFGFFTITGGDLWSALALTVGLEIILLFVLSIF